MTWNLRDHRAKVKQFRKSSQCSHSVWHGVFMTTDHSLKVKQFRKSSQHSHSVRHGVFVTTDHSESWHGQEAEVDLVGFRRLSVQTMKIHNSPCGQFKPVLSAWVELTLSLPRCYLKMTNKSVRCQILKPFFLSFLHQQLKRFSSKCTLLKLNYSCTGWENTLFAGMCMHFSTWKFYRLGQWGG